MRVTTNKKKLDRLSYPLQKSIQEFNPSQYLIMIIGQDQEMCLLLKILLELWQYKTVEANTIEEAKNISHFFKPELILMDTSISFSQTLENLHRIRQTKDFSDLPLFVISGYSQPEFRNIALSNGADDFFVKPLNFRKMEVSLEKFISRNKNLTV